MGSEVRELLLLTHISHTTSAPRPSRPNPSTPHARPSHTTAPYRPIHPSSSLAPGRHAEAAPLTTVQLNFEAEQITSS